MGFVNFCYYKDDENNNPAHLICAFTVESGTGKVVSVWATRAAQAQLKAFGGEPVPPGLPEAYVRYLGLDAFEDWAAPEDTDYEVNGLYSPSAAVLLRYAGGQSEQASLSGAPQEIFSVTVQSVQKDVIERQRAYRRSFINAASKEGKVS